MTKEELALVLPEPFNHFAMCGSIDYRCKDGRDHIYLREHGFETHMNTDASSSCDKIPSFNFSSYGWGTMFDNTTDEGRQIFHDMWVAGIIELWRGRTYTFDGKIIEYQGGKYIMWDREMNNWTEINNPFENDNKSN